MNNNSERIERYLQNEMSTEERTAFETALLTDSELKYELQVQRSITEAAYNAGLKTVFARAIGRKAMTSKLRVFGIAAVAICTLFLALYQIDIKKENGATEKTLARISDAFIHPALPGIDVPFTEFSFDAEKGDTLFAPSGSVLYFPPSALTDEAGNIIKGVVQVKYREFKDPADFFVSGISMDYDSAGVKYNFESAGMCEINAYRQNKKLFVNPNARPEIFLSSHNNDPKQNLYYLDTANRSWNYMGKDLITPVKNVGKLRPGSVSANNNIASDSISGNNEADYDETPRPVKPAKASGDHQSFSIEIEPGSFEELSAYNNLKFEVIDESTYRRADADEHWDNVKLAHGASEGIYTITFSNSARKVSYKVRPILEGADYDAAIKLFNEKNKVYEDTQKKRIAAEKAETDSLNKNFKKMQDKWNADNAENDRINAVIAERNKRMKQQMETRKKEIEKQIADEVQKQKESLKNVLLQKQALTYDQILELQKQELARVKTTYEKNMAASDEVFRCFPLRNFGIWNCDQPRPPQGMPLYANFTDTSNKPLGFYSVSVVYRRFNGIARFYNSASIGVMPGEENMIWAVQDSSFYYFTYKDFKNAGITGNTKTYTFKMHRAEKMVSSYDEIKALVENNK